MHNRPQLFCFTYAGGSASFFDEIGKDLSGIDVIKIEYAGHGSRWKEPFYENFHELAEDLFDKIKDQLKSDYALLGYSMGSISLIEVLQYIINKGLPIPMHVFLSAHEPHMKSELKGFVFNESDERIKQRTVAFGDVPEKLIDNKVFWRMYLPLYRADYSIISKYEFETLFFKTMIPATIFYSETDTPIRDMKLWKNYFTGDVEFCRYEGNHFFIREHHREMADVIQKHLGVQ